MNVLDFLLKPWVATCRETSDHLSDYVDDELTGRSLTRVQRHLHRCKHCQALLESLTRTLDQLRSLGATEPAEPPPGTVDAIVSRIRSKG